MTYREAWKYVATDEHGNETLAAECRWCERRITWSFGYWIDPLATGDDAIWRETCDEHDTFEAKHEPTLDKTT